MLEVRGVQVIQGGKTLWDNLSFCLRAGERLGISAPSGFGKTTLGRILAQWQTPAAGDVLIDGKLLPRKGYCPVQLVPQHPEKCFNPYRTTGAGVNDSWTPDAAWLAKLCIEPEWLLRRPDALSGGELARIALLRALDPRTRFLVADEVTAQLDAHIQAQVWRVLIGESVQRPLGMVIFSHNKALLSKVCTSVWTVSDADMARISP